MATRVILTYEDYAALPADGRRYEVHEGELSVTPAPTPRHQEVTGNLWALLRQHVMGRGAGRVFFAPLDCLLGETTVVQPDIIYVEADGPARVTDRGIEGPPGLVVEVVSPSTGRIDREVKRQLYARHGVPHYWLVDPEARVIVAYRLVETAYAEAGRLAGPRAGALPPFPELGLDPGAIWPAA